MNTFEFYAFVIAPLMVLATAGLGYAYIVRLDNRETERLARTERGEAPHGR